MPLHIWHISNDPPSGGNGSPGEGCRIAQYLAQLNDAQVTVIPDLFRALARLCRPENPKPDALLVCLDHAQPEDLEFFAITSRHCGDLPVYVYGNDRSEVWVARALRLGATSRADRIAFEVLATRAEQKQADGKANLFQSDREVLLNDSPDIHEQFDRYGQPEVSETPKVLESYETIKDRLQIEPDQESCSLPASDHDDSAPTIHVAQASDAIEQADEITQAQVDEVTQADEAEQADEIMNRDDEAEVANDFEPANPSTARRETVVDDSNPSIRFPWVRYHDAPLRRPPVQAPPNTPFETTVSPHVWTAAHEPLLTPEEVEALIGTDEEFGDREKPAASLPSDSHLPMDQTP